MTAIHITFSQDVSKVFKKLTKNNEIKVKQNKSTLFIMPTSKNYLIKLLKRQCPGGFPYQLFNNAQFMNERNNLEKEYLCHMAINDKLEGNPQSKAE